MSLSLRQFETLQAIARHGTLIAAAQALHMTPAALTARLKALEEIVGVALFDRTPTGMRITMAGQTALETAERLDQETRLFLERMTAIRAGAAGRLSVAAVSTAKYFAPRLIAAFKNSHPEVELRLLIGNRAETIAALKGLHAEIALMGRPPSDVPAEKDVLGAHPYVLIAPPFHRLAGRRAIAKEELGREAFLYREEGSGSRSIHDFFIGDVAVRGAQVGIELGSNESIKQAAMAGLGVALISAHTIAAELQDGRLVLLDVEGLPILRHWFAIRRADRPLSPIARVFHDFLVERGADFLPRLPRLPRESGRGARGGRGARA